MEQFDATAEAVGILYRRRDRLHSELQGMEISQCEIHLDGAFTVAELYVVGRSKVVKVVGVAKYNPNDYRIVKTPRGEQKVSCYNREAGIRRAIHRAIVNAERANASR